MLGDIDVVGDAVALTWVVQEVSQRLEAELLRDKGHRKAVCYRSGAAEEGIRLHDALIPLGNLVRRGVEVNKGREAEEQIAARFLRSRGGREGGKRRFLTKHHPWCRLLEMHVAVDQARYQKPLVAIDLLVAPDLSFADVNDAAVGNANVRVLQGARSLRRDQGHVSNDQTGGLSQSGVKAEEPHGDGKERESLQWPSSGLSSGHDGTNGHGAVAAMLANTARDENGYRPGAPSGLSQRLRRIDAGCTACGQIAGEHAGTREEQRHAEQCDGIVRADLVQRSADQRRHRERANES